MLHNLNRNHAVGKALIPLLIFLCHRSPGETPPALERTITSFADEHHFNGSILVRDKGQSVYQHSFGLADRSFAVPARDDTRYKIASITKLFTSVLILQLHQEGKLDLDGKIGTYLTDFPGEAAQRVSITQLLNHTSGLPQYDSVGSYQEAFAKGVDRYQRPLDVSALIQLCCDGKLTHPPGSKFDYNNADYFVLGRIIEHLTSQSYEKVVTDRILRPLGLQNTGMMHWDAIVERLAPTYFYRDDTKQLINDMPVYYENWYAAAGMYSTTSDLARFAEALFSAELLKPESLQLILKAGLDDYGLGLWSYSIERGGKHFRVAKRPGSNMGANSVLYRLLDEKTTIVLLANTNRTDLDVFAQHIADVLVAGERN